MSRLWKVAVGGTLFAIGFAAGASGQVTEDELSGQIDSLTALLADAEVRAAAEAERLAAVARRESESAGTVDTLFVDGLTVLAPSDDAVLAETIFRDVWAEHFAHLGSDAPPRGAVFTFQRIRDRHPIHVEDGPVVHRVDVSWWHTVATARTRVRRALSAAVTVELAGSATHRWTSADPLAEHDFADVYRALAATPSRAARACLEGDVTACRHALGLGIGAEEAITLWYSPIELRSQIVTRYLHSAGLEEEQERACVLDADLDACVVLAGWMPNRFPAPLDGAARASLLGVALEMGGSGAWSRLVSEPGADPLDLLPRVADAEIDELVSAWRARVIGARPVSYADLAGTSLATLFWIVVFITFATRSTRWRLG